MKMIDQRKYATAMFGCLFLAGFCWAALSSTSFGQVEAELRRADGQSDDPYEVPVTEDILELQLFIGRLSSIQPQDLEEYEEHLLKLPIALNTVANRIMELDPDPASPAYTQAEFLTFVAAVLGVRQASHDERVALVDRVAARLTDHPRLADDAGLAEQLAESLAALGEEELARSAYTTFGSRLQDSITPDIATLGKRMLGTVRRMDLMGTRLEFRGQTLDGQPFDPATLQGKVVLVDFWATWCGPCVREIPRLADLHQLYKSDGFEIVAVSLDADRIRVEEFIENEEVPWICLFQDGTGWDHPMAVYYGIKALPTTMLLDQEGNVIAFDVRAEDLAEKLPEVLGIARKESTVAPAVDGSEPSADDSDR
ncbi:MAG: TlpA family protein disulfide reductase [Planctomycetales bacterium]|nr:TlpA family protein disulfide reductase [Planctomycetales bacterium]